MVNKVCNVLLVLILIFTSLFLVAPLVLLVWKGAGSVIPSLASEEMLFAIRLSFQTTALATLICLLVAVLSSYAMFQAEGRFLHVLTGLLYLPMSLPHLVSGMALLLLFGRRGIGDVLYRTFGLDFIFTKSGIVLALVFVNLPFAINMVLTALQDSNQKMVFAARTLGCGEMQAFFRITLPALRRTVVSAAVMTWSRALGEFGAVIMVAGTTRMKTETLPTAIFLNMATGDLDLAAGAAVILILISLTCLLLFELLMPSAQKKPRGRRRKPVC